jgi:hypothetical protein
MPTLRLVVPSTPRVTASDAVMVAWAIAWIAVALLVAHYTRQVANVGETVSATGDALQKSGGLIASLPLPLPNVHDTAASIQAAGASAVDSGHTSAEATRRLAVLLGLAIGVLPSVPILGLYLPIRVWRIRDARRIRSDFVRYGDDPGFKEFLAQRAAHNLSFEALRDVTDAPWADLREGRFDRLAEAELERLGVETPSA